MIITLDNLTAGVRRWHELGFDADIQNGEYYEIYGVRAGGVTEQWWKATVERLGRWRAYRGPKPPNTKAEIFERGVGSLGAIAEQHAHLTARAGTEPSIVDLRWEDVEPLFAVAGAIKPGSLVFATKMCHFLFPKLFIVMDNQLTEVFEYEFYWRGMKEEWSRFSEKGQALRILTDSIETNRAPHRLYPWETKLMELSHAGYKHRAAIRTAGEGLADGVGTAG